MRGRLEVVDRGKYWQKEGTGDGRMSTEVINRSFPDVLV